eukprot:NODE_279_length_10886_cov_0.340039.p6 type:complete len:250 gc:universal NODE_279_length_10886_cov_0.340039:3425-2676(-)
MWSIAVVFASVATPSIGNTATNLPYKSSIAWPIGVQRMDPSTDNAARVAPNQNTLFSRIKTSSNPANQELVDEYLNGNTALDIQDNNGKFPLDIAIERNDMISLMDLIALGYTHISKSHGEMGKLNEFVTQMIKRKQAYDQNNNGFFGPIKRGNEYWHEIEKSEKIGILDFTIQLNPDQFESIYNNYSFDLNEMEMALKTVKRQLKHETNDTLAEIQLRLTRDILKWLQNQLDGVNEAYDNCKRDKLKN